MSVCVVGRDAVATAHAVQYALKGDFGVIVAHEKVNAVIADEPGVEHRWKTAAGRQRLTTSRDIEGVVRGSRVVVIAIAPEFAGHRVDSSELMEATERVGRGLTRDSLVIFETLVSVGTTRNLLIPMLERESKMTSGSDFKVAFSPRREREGQVLLDFVRLPKVFGCLDATSRDWAQTFYNQAFETILVPMDSFEAAEIVPFMEAMSRTIASAVSNEFALYAMQQGVDSKQASLLANTQPYFPFHPMGLDSVPDRCALVSALWNQSATSAMGEVASMVQERVIVSLVESLNAMMGKLEGARILALADALGPRVQGTRLLEMLRERGALVTFDRSDESMIDAMVVLTDRVSFHELRLDDLPRCLCLVDGSNALSRDRVERAGKHYIGVGRFSGKR